MKKLLFFALALIILSSAFGFTGCSSEPTEVIQLTCANYLPITHNFTALQQEWCNEIMARTDNRVNITYYPGGSLVKAAEVPDALEGGTVDIAFSHIGYNPGRFPVSEALDLPNGYPTGWVGSHVATDFFNEYQTAEWANFHVLFVNAGCTAGLMLRDTKVTRLEDLAGKILRGTGEVAAAITALGATATGISMVEMNEAVSKGVADGALVGIETLKTFKMGDVCRYTAFAWQPGNMYTFYLAMNKAKWDALPGDIKDIFNEVSEEFAERYAITWNMIDIAGIQYSLSVPGNEVYLLSDAEGVRFKTAVQPVITNYIEAMVGKGFNRAEVEGWISFIKDRILYWQSEESKRNLPSPFDLNLPVG